MPNGPLSDVVVIDLTRVLAGPCRTTVPCPTRHAFIYKNNERHSERRSIHEEQS